MKTRNLLAAVALLSLAASALAALSPEKAKWGEGPVQFLMTSQEAARGDGAGAIQKAVAAMVVRPEVMPVADSNKPLPQPVVAPPPPPAAPEVKTAAYAAAIADAKSGKGAGKGAVITSAEFVSPSGAYYAPVMLYIPKASGLTADAADTFFWAVDDANGKRVSAGEEPAKLTATRGDFYADRTIEVPAAGKYIVTMGLGKGGAPVAAAASAL